MKRYIRSITIACIMVLICSATSVFAASDEMEPNDSRMTANLITVGQIVYGQEDGDEYSYDEDWYKFVAPISGTMSFYCKADAANSDYHPAGFYILDRDGMAMESCYEGIDTDSGKTLTFGVISGNTYYIRCWTAYNKQFSYHFKLSYSIGKTTIKSVKPAKKAFTVTWNKKAKASFYQVQYIKKSTYQDYSWSKAKIVKVSGKSKSKKIKGLAKKKQYYVRVRVARTINGVTYYSAWSPKKVVKTK